MVVAEAANLRASFCQKSVHAAKRALGLMQFHAGDPAALSNTCFYLWQAMEVCYNYAQAWQVVVDCALNAHEEMLRSGRWARWMEYLEMALDASRRLEDKSAEMKVLLYLGRMQERCGEWSAAHRRLEKVLQLADQLGDHNTRGRALTILAELERHAGQIEDSQQRIQQALEALGGTQDAQALSAAYRGLGNIMLQRGDDNEAVAAYTTALKYAEACGDLYCLASAHHNLGNICAQRGDTRGAAVQYHHALELFRQAGDPSGEAVAMLNIGLACQSDRGYWQQASDTYHEVVALSEKAGYYHGQAIALCNLIDVLLKLGQVDHALAEIEQLHNLYARTNNAYGMAVVEHDRGTICLAQGDAETALLHFQRAKKVSEWATDAEEMAPAETNIGRAYARLGQWEEAEAAYQHALDLWVTFTELPGELETWLSLVELYRQMKAWGKLESTLETARELAQRIEREDALALLNAALADAYFAADEVQAGCEAYATALRNLAQPGENNRKADYLRRVTLQAQAQAVKLEIAGHTEAAATMRAVIQDNMQQETSQE